MQLLGLQRHWLRMRWQLLLLHLQRSCWMHWLLRWPPSCCSCRRMHWLPVLQLLRGMPQWSGWRWHWRWRHEWRWRDVQLLRQRRSCLGRHLLLSKQLRRRRNARRFRLPLRLWRHCFKRRRRPRRRFRRPSLRRLRRLLRPWQWRHRRRHRRRWRLAGHRQPLCRLVSRPVLIAALRALLPAPASAPAAWVAAFADLGVSQRLLLLLLLHLLHQTIAKVRMFAQRLASPCPADAGHDVPRVPHPAGKDDRLLEPPRSQQKPGQQQLAIHWRWQRTFYMLQRCN